MFKRFVNQATIPFFQPMEELTEAQWGEFQKHYGSNVSKKEIINNVYGGEPLDNLFSHFQLETDESRLRNLRATIRLIPAEANLKPLVVKNLSFKQFLVAGLPSRDLLPWDGKDNWKALDPQYRLELCHAEVSRWSIFIKRNGKTLSDAVLENHEVFSDIELINNCTTSFGFEFKVVRDGIQYHGSFGRRNDNERWKTGVDDFAYLYRRLSQWQAGSLGDQNKELIDERGLNFFSYYFNPIPRSLKKGNFEFDISLERYRSLNEKDGKETLYRVEINRDEIDYKRWGASSEYYQKPQQRRLMKSIKDCEGRISKEPPLKYSEIETATEIILPNFQETGIYDLSDPQSKRYYGWLYQFNACAIRYLSDERVELELRRAGIDGEYELRRFVFGNISLQKIPVYPEFWTLHRFGYGARDTVMDYESEFVPPSDTPVPSYYAYQLGGEGKAEEANNYICPEGFGVERAIFSWEDESRTRLVIDLISFERILPLWQGVVDISEPLKFN